MQFLFGPANRLYMKLGADQFTGCGQHRKSRHQVLPGDISRGQTGGTSLPDQQKEEETEAELAVGGASAWVVVAAPWAGKGMFLRQPCGLRVCCTLPNHKALLGAPLPRLITICQPRYQRCHLSQRQAVSAMASKGPNPVLPFPKAVLSGHPGLLVPRGPACLPVNFPLPFSLSCPFDPNPTPTQTFPPFSSLLFTAGR